MITRVGQRLTLKLQEELQERAVHLRVYTSMALKFADMLSVITFSEPLLALYEPIIRAILTHNHAEFNEEDILRRFSEAVFPADLFESLLAMALPAEHREARNCQNKQLLFIENMLLI